jgi:hypothetical protein
MTYTRASTSNMILPIICAVIISKVVGYFENSTLSAFFRKQAFILSGSYIDSRTGK